MKDMIGKRFGKLIVTGFCEKRFRSGCYWNCICDCGNKVIVKTGNLPYTKSCGCLNRKEIKWQINANGCWECTSHSGARGGYPQIQRDGKYYLLSRFMYKKYIGEIPDGMLIRHKCDNPKCINPEHLEIGTSKDNAQDKIKRNRFKQAKLTENQVTEILLKIKVGISRAKIAREYNVGKTTITDIATLKSWEYIPRP